MANHFSALKRARQTEKRTAVNRANTSQLRTSLRAMREIHGVGDAKLERYGAAFLEVLQNSIR